MTIARSLGRAPHPEDWAPHAPQMQFLRLACFEALYGGAAGGGKSDALLADAAYYVGKGYGRAYSALALRRTFPELETSLIRRSFALYPRLGGVYRERDHAWTFPAGERVAFGHCEYTKDVHRYQGSAFARLLFDELATFDEYQYLYLLSRIRSAEGVPCGVRAASNPGGVGHGWVRKRFGAWVSRKHPTPTAPGVVRYYVRRGDKDEEVPWREPGALGRTFIPALLEDNPSLAQNDPGYRARLLALPALERARLLAGDWDKEPAAKDYYDRARVRILRACPANADVVARCRAWDFGGTADGDPSVGLRASFTREGLFVVEHVVRFQGAPDVLYANFGEVATQDRERDWRTVQWIPEDPGAAGKITVADFQNRFRALAIQARRPSADKPSRFRPASSRALAGNFAVVDDGSWDVEAYHDELEAFPLGTYDDQVDATSDAYAGVAEPPVVTGAIERNSDR